MVRSVTVFDEDVTEDDMAAALDWQTEQANTCSCGQPIDESMAPGRDDAYEAEILVCHACAAVDRKERVYRDGGGDMAGVKRQLRPVD